jgi:hypothetical protein
MAREQRNILFATLKLEYRAVHDHDSTDPTAPKAYDTVESAGNRQVPITRRKFAGLKNLLPDSSITKCGQLGQKRKDK